MKIEVGKKYKTRSGDPVRIYATDGLGDYPVHGAFFEGGWKQLSWTAKGVFNLGSVTTGLNLEEIKDDEEDDQCLPLV